MAIYLSVVSHNNDELIEENFASLPPIIGNEKFIISIVDNTSSKKLEKICTKNNLLYYSDGKRRGYGENNNLNFKKLNPSSNDIFIVCNPDITLVIEYLKFIFEKFRKSSSSIYGVKIFESKDLSKFSSHNRKFPALLDPMISLVFKKKLFERNADVFANPDWIGGGFMIFKTEAFRELNGFDNRYFMYYEDVDICHRAKKKGMEITYDPSFYVVHEAKRAGRKIFSQSFFYNLISMIKYFSRFPTLRLVTISK